MLKILIAPDKFKGTLSAMQVAEAIRDGLAAGFGPEMPAEFHLLPIADGGEGTTETLCNILNANVLELPAQDALGRPCQGAAGLAGELGILEVAAAAGMWRIAAEERDPWKSSTFGVGLMLRELEVRGARRILAGLGGSATNDAGLGMAAAVGFRFIDKAGRQVLPLPQNWDSIVAVARPEKPLLVEVTVLCDVTNPLLGPKGASHVYGPQKGVKDPGFIDKAMERVTDLVVKCLGSDYRGKPGAGAAGGLGYGFLTFTNAHLVEGFRTIAELTHLEDAVAEADLVITGEGRIDTQTFSGKGPSGIASLAVRLGKPVHLFCGLLGADLAASDLDPAIRSELATWSGIHPLVGEGVTSHEALADSARVLRRRASQLAKVLRSHRAI
ncbi:glycerate kinase [Verrucomicrobia bacterium LW23]|nr:glycerate kinase [Verrucomicrobia bacterium LW23]